MKANSVSKMLMLSCALSATIMGSTALGAVFSDQGALDQSRVYGQDPMWSNVGVVGLYTSGGTWGAGGTGIIVGDGSWVLCSGHQLTVGDYSNVRFSLRDSAGAITTVVGASQWFTYPGYNGSGTGQGVDLALIHLSQPITSVPAAELYNGSISSLTGVTAAMAGFGRPGIAGMGVSPYDGIKRAGNNVIGDTAYPVWLDSSQYLVTGFDGPNSGLAVGQEWQASPGDSGSPWMVRVGGRWQVAGITSGVTLDPLYNFENAAYAMSVSGQLPWLNSYIAAVPEPQTNAAVAAGLLLAALYRHKRRAAQPHN